jgi:hypothetical protein
MTKPASGDRRWPATIVLLALGVVLVLLTDWWQGDSWKSFGGAAVYSVGWATCVLLAVDLTGLTLNRMPRSGDVHHDDHDRARSRDR